MYHTGEQGFHLISGAVDSLTMLLIVRLRGSSTKINELQALTPLCKAQKEPICILLHLLTFKTPVPSILPLAEGDHPAMPWVARSIPKLKLGFNQGSKANQWEVTSSQADNAALTRETPVSFTTNIRRFMYYRLYNY